MPAGLVLPLSGPYSGTWNALAMGVQSDDGWALNCTVQGQEVNETDQYGMTLVEAIYRGQNWRARTRALELTKTGPQAVLLMFGQTGAVGSLTPNLSNIGSRWTDYAKSLVLTAILANPPSSPATITALNSALAPQQNSETMFTSKVRELPLEWVLIPYSAVVGSLTFAIPFTST